MRAWLVLLGGLGIAAFAAVQDPAVAPRDSSPTLLTDSSHAKIAERLHHGVDVSGHSGSVDWKVVADGSHTFAFVKATEGVDFADTAFARNWRALKESGLVRGAYHFYVTEDDPEAQARFFIETVSLEPGDLAPVVDVELIGHGTKPGLAKRLKVCLDILEHHYGVKPIIYTTAKFWDTHMVGDGSSGDSSPGAGSSGESVFGAYPLWVAEYEVEEPVLPATWADWHLWQWKGDAEIAGVEKGADLTRVNRGGPDLSGLIVPR